MSDIGRSLAVVTPSYAPDADLFCDLHRSVLANTSEATVHHVIVPEADAPLFAGFAGDRCRVWTVPELLPARYVRLPRRGWWVDVRRPWPPIRGWVLQQALKICLAGRLAAGVVVMADSDVVLVRDVDPDRLVEGDELVLFRSDDAVHAGMDRHVRWHAVARTLLGLPTAPLLPLPDYVSALSLWSPPVVRAMQDRIERVTGRSWLDAFVHELHISEFILYGLFVDEIWSESHGPAPVAGVLCHDYWNREPMDDAAAVAFADGMPPAALGMMISAKSGTSGRARRAAIARCAALVGDMSMPDPVRDVIRP